MPAINADFFHPVWLNRDDGEWVASPQGGVERLMLDRVGDEVAVATSLVRYAPESQFPAHDHALGEEYVVLEGEFGDEHGRYPAGTYVRNPAGTNHTPFSEPGCLIFVKLRQFDPADQRQMVLALPEVGASTEVIRHELHRYQDEVVSCIVAPAGARIDLPAGETVQEVLLLDGCAAWGDVTLHRHGWLRVPAGEGIFLQVKADCRLLHKTRPGYAIPG